MQRLCVLGSTGSIGHSTLDVVARHPDRFRVVALAAHSQVARLFAQILQFRPERVVMVDTAAAAELRNTVREAGLPTEVLAGAESLPLIAAADDIDTVMAAIVGAAGLLPTLAAAEAGKRVLLANKEALVMSGALFMDAVRRSGALLLPIDSEHNAVFQCLPGPKGCGAGQVRLRDAGIERILLTASGGPFLHRPLADLGDVTPDQACRHPTWNMGRKISVDSATLMNKGLEVIEACWLFDARPEQVEVVIHPQSVVHSLVRYSDGSVLAELGNPDMRTPIAHALAWPERIVAGVDPLDLAATGQLNFFAADRQRFPCLQLAYDALAAVGSAAAVLNAANEVAVAAFLAGQLRFTAIPAIIGDCLAKVAAPTVTDLAALLAVDAEARAVAGQLVRARVAA